MFSSLHLLLKGSPLEADKGSLRPISCCQEQSKKYCPSWPDSVASCKVCHRFGLSPAFSGEGVNVDGDCSSGELL